MHRSDESRVTDGNVDAVMFQKALCAIETFRAKLIVAE